ncbi:SRS domain-containing protein [Neospora caninum Liverpool]|uniref:SRS domain-containing protein n=1 Tax=Neospora caninum (strain Liverpool) TaxID=572307 RepID=F0VGY6_NEOCL|nr:SRS domain-containing protein [Neospora caninum Liverpool]CBZ52980.1 SRS domain-containing protein [Neospora caninum Liverpool]CEL66966.1 TPA: SRS domain-containing protein [Neospora caninum Liverpool]|eukprot:XP_003883012.1 SRS domain-containing protein [Neospora caninum Liverpool]
MARYLVHAGGVFRPLGRVLLLAGLIQFVNRTAQSTAVEVPTHTCASDRIEVSLTPGNLAVKLVCPPESPLSPAGSNNALQYTNGTCGEQKTLTELLGNGSTATWDGSTLTMSKLPTEAKQICYQCKKSSDVTCTAVINVASMPKSCTASGAPGRSLTAGSGDLVLQVENTDAVYFTCPTNYNLDPDNASQVYVEEGEECANSPTTRDDIERKGDQTNGYSFRLKEQPQKEETFCYKCKKAGVKTGEECTIKVKSVTTTTTTVPESSTDDESTDSNASGAATVNYVTGLLWLAVMWLGYLL